MSNDISEKDKKDWESFISSDEKLPNKDFKSSKQKTFKVRSIDLHGYTLEEANQIIEKIIYQSFREKINKLIVVTGKGIHSQNEKDPYVSKNLSILKYSVPEFIKSDEELNKLILSVTEADIKDGGEGALLIKMKN